MWNLLLITPHNRSLAEVETHYRASGRCVARLSLDRSSPEICEQLWKAFEGKPPHVCLIDLTTSPDTLPLRHLQRFLHELWGRDAPPPLRLSLLAPRHLTQPDWVAFTDDFLLSSDLDEIKARVDALFFRKRNATAGRSLICADLHLDLQTSTASHSDGTALALRPREFQLLQFLVTHRGKFFARDRLLALVWGLDFEGGERTVDIHVRRLRAKLPPKAMNLLETRRGIGYGFVSPSA